MPEGAAAAAPVLLVEQSQGITTLTLNRPASMNALSRELRTELVRAFRRVCSDVDTGAVIVTGAGRAFCAGLDLEELSSAGSSGSLAAVTDAAEDVVVAMRSCDRPIIGAVNGFAITGGLEMALACDVLIASTEARFADTHVRLGLVPGWGLSQLLPRVIGVARAKELSLTGNFLSAPQAAAWGLVNRVVAPDELLPACRALAADMLSSEPDALRAVKRITDAGYAVSLSEGLALERRTFEVHARLVTPASLAARRAAVQRRGRVQAS